MNDHSCHPRRCRIYLPVLVMAVSSLLSIDMVSASEPNPIQKNLIMADLKKLSIEDLMNVEVETVYAASKHEQKVTEAPSSVTIITADDIRKYGYRTLADILKSVRSFYITYDRHVSYVGVRGFGRPGDYNSRILMLLDGHRLNDNIFGSALIGTEAGIDLDLIDRIEIVRGPGSSLYGNNAFFAVLNIITKRGREYGGFEISGSAASYDTWKGRITAGNRFETGLEAVISASVSDSKGQRLYFPEFDVPPANGIVENEDNDTFQTYFSALSWKDFSLEAGYMHRTKRIPKGLFRIDTDDPGNRITLQGGVIDLKYRHQFSRRTEISALVFFDYFSYEGSFLYSGFPANKDSAVGERVGGDLKLAIEPISDHRVTLGAEFQDDLRQDQKNYFVDFIVQLDDHRSSSRYALYFQDEVTISSAVLLNAGVRYDHYDTFGATANPRLALVLIPATKTSIKFLYGTAFRAPDAYELYYHTDVPTQSANPDLEPERIRTSEIVYEQYLGDRFRYTLSAYYYVINNLIDAVDVSGSRMYLNISRVRTHGAEAGLENRWVNGMEARASYTYQKSENVMTGEELTNSPAHLGKLNLSVPLVRRKVWLGIEEQYMSRRTTFAGGRLSGVGVTNLTVFSRNLRERLELSASVYNLFDRAYRDPVNPEHEQSSILQDGRNYRLKLTYLF